ncbi:hypothetical protein EV382_6114 [Micromonospora violae]|uniref:Hemerythrin HHE cation binding domain-containing protein n=1 Tax=Micromonospora violae TaxID=1278207 RepID=A0A4Q7UQA7_9ACTN|nr:hypothetical protein [Micromonospora violae]RZT82801.1 hypothetical protein EV382_6114 [Micromonospora violae]
MVTGPVQQPSLVARSRVPHPTGPAADPPPVGLPGEPRPAGLAGDVHALGRAVAVTSTGPRWREDVLLRLGPVRQGFAEHVRATEGPTGLYRELLAQSPRLDHGVRLLTREHAVIVAAILAAQQIAERPGTHPDELRHRVGHLLRRLARHRRRGADLLWEAYQTDLGGET